MRFIFSLFLTSLLCTNFATANTLSKKQLYQLKDLEVLENNKEYIEFFNHAKDVLPRKRSKIWQNMVLSMAMQMLAPLKKKQNTLELKDYELILKISHWPVLKNNEFFIQQRDAVLLNHFKYCFINNNYKDCYSKVLDFKNKYETSTEFSFHLIKKIQNIKTEQEEYFFYSEQYGFWNLVSDLVKHELSEFYCHKSPLKETITNKLFALSYTSDELTITDHIHKDCWSSIHDYFKHTLLTNKDDRLRAKMLALLKGQINFTKNEKYLSSVLNLLSDKSHSPKEVIKLWDEIKILSQDYKLRNKILKQLKAITPLPGELFNAKTKQHKLMAKAINQYFPEYIDFYATTCLDHLRGIIETPGGNPAMRCHELFNLSKSLKLLPQGKQDQYFEIMKY